MSRLADRVRASLGAASGAPRSASPPPKTRDTSELIFRLRREVARIERSPSPPPPAETACARAPRPAAPDRYRHRFDACLRLPGALEHASGSPPPRLLPDAPSLPLATLLAHGEGDEPLGDLKLSDLVFVDTETTGLSRGAGTIAFLIGVGRFEGAGEEARFRVDQHVVEEPAREGAVLRACAEQIAGARLLVTFNGKSFDLPILAARAMLNRFDLGLPARHIDLLSWARRLYRARVGDCRLSTLEREVLGVRRVHDLPGSEAPAAYLRYLRSKDPRQLHGILQHNLIDVASMAALLWRVGQLLEDPLRWAEDGDELCAVASLTSAGGDGRRAERYLARALVLPSSSTSRRRALRLAARLRRRRGDMEGAKAQWQRYVDEFPLEDEGWIALAKHYEHHEQDFRAALRCARRASTDEDGELAHRVARLERRLAACSLKGVDSAR